MTVFRSDATRKQRRTIRNAVRSAEGQKEVREFVMKRITEGKLNFTFGKGVMNHITFGFTTPVALCGKMVDGMSSSPIVTKKGELCKKCAKIVGDTYLVFLDEVDEKDGPELTAAFRQKMTEYPKDWVEGLVDFK
jgi:hypothetical protein